MADNKTLPLTGSGDATTVVATDEVTYSGDTAQVQLVKVVTVQGSEGAKTVTELENTALDVSGAIVEVTNSIERGNADVFSRTVVTNPFNDIDVQFFKAAPSVLLNVTTANSGTAVQNIGGALFSSSTNASGSVQGVTTETTNYHSGTEIYAMFTASFTAGIASSYMRIGLYDADDGMFIGYEGTSFGVTYRNNTTDTTVAKGSFSEDLLTGAADSLFTRAGTPEAIDLTKLNVFRIRFGWLGSAPAYWEVLAPDGHWVVFHKTLFPNLQANPSIRNPNLPITIDITKTAAAATDLAIQTDCWGAGTTAGNRSANTDVYAFSTTALLNNGASFDSTVKALSPEFSQVSTSVLASHDGTITITWYSDAAGTDVVRTLTIAYVAADGYQLFSAPSFAPYVKYVFLNDSGVNQTDFYFDTKLMRRPLSPQILRVDGPVADGMVASVTRSLITAYDGTNYTNVGATIGGNLKVAIEENDAGNLTTNTVQLGGTAISMNTGTRDAGTQRVTIATDDSVPVTGTVTANAGTGTFTVDLGANNDMQGPAAHDAVYAGNPFPQGFHAVAHGASPTAVAAGDTTKGYANRHGIPFQMAGHPNIVTIRANYTAAQTDTAIVTATAGQKIIVTRCSVTADSANTVNVQARIGFGATTTPTTTGVCLSHPGISAGSGVVEGSGAGMLGVGADGEDLRITSTAPTTGSIDVVTSYYIVES